MHRNRAMSLSNFQQQAGFSLFELVLGIVLLGILMAGSLAMLINLAPKTVDPAMEVRAAQLAQRLLNDISLQKYDHNNTPTQICGAGTCTAADEYGPDIDEDTLSVLNDVDDYHTPAICSNSNFNAPCNNDWIDACWFTGQCSGSGNVYSQFKVRVLVIKPVAAFDNEPDSAKQIEISVRLPKGAEWHYAVLRGNYL